MSAVSKYLAAIGRRGGKAGKGSAAKAASAKKANAARWKGNLGGIAKQKISENSCCNAQAVGYSDCVMSEAQ